MEELKRFKQKTFPPTTSRPIDPDTGMYEMYEGELEYIAFRESQRAQSTAQEAKRLARIGIYMSGVALILLVVLLLT
jgi:hypothetical protein